MATNVDLCVLEISEEEEPPAGGFHERLHKREVI